MLINYIGKQTALSVQVAGRNIRLTAGTPALLSAKDYEEFSKRPFTKTLLKGKQIEFSDVDKLNKSGLQKLAISQGFTLTGKETAAELAGLFVEADDKTSGKGKGLDK